MRISPWIVFKFMNCVLTLFPSLSLWLFVELCEFVCNLVTIIFFITILIICFSSYTFGVCDKIIRNKLNLIQYYIAVLFTILPRARHPQSLMLFVSFQNTNSILIFCCPNLGCPKWEHNSTTTLNMQSIYTDAC